jgi:hypothetical protein
MEEPQFQCSKSHWPTQVSKSGAPIRISSNLDLGRPMLQGLAGLPEKGEFLTVRSTIRFIALFLLTLFGSVEGVRMGTSASIQACACGCGAPSEDLCGCKAPVQPASPTQSSKPCSEPSRGCSTTTGATTSLISTNQEGEAAKRDPEPKRKPQPWPALVSHLGISPVSSVLRMGYGTAGEVSPPWRSLQRLAWLSTFRN